MNTPGALGVPDKTPVLEFSVSPVAGAPLVMDHASGAVPPVAISVCENGVPTTPGLSGLVVVITGAALTSIVGLLEPVLLPPSVTEMEVLKVFAAVTVPVIKQVADALQLPWLSPVGRLLSVHMRDAVTPQLFAVAVIVLIVCPTVYGPGLEGDRETVQDTTPPGSGGLSDSTRGTFAPTSSITNVASVESKYCM